MRTHVYTPEVMAGKSPENLEVQVFLVDLTETPDSLVMVSSLDT